MKNVVSVSLGSSKRDHEVKVNLFGNDVLIRRIGVDGDFAKARQLFLELQNEVDVFGLGGAEFGINFHERYYPIRAVKKLTAGLEKPVVDGSGIRAVVERSIGNFLSQELGKDIQPKRVLFCVASARYDMVLGFAESSFKMKFGDPGFILGLPITSSSFWLAKKAGRIFIPLVVRLPFKWLYPTGKSQHLNRPKFKRWFDWATVIADDFHYIKRHLPEDIAGKIIVTNTTTQDDVEMLRQRGAKILVTSTPEFDGRSFGTNVLEAAITAAVGGPKLTVEEVGIAIDELGLQPSVTRLNE